MPARYFFVAEALVDFAAAQGRKGSSAASHGRGEDDVGPDQQEPRSRRASSSAGTEHGVRRNQQMELQMFDLVPWSHGYAHSWALRWMLLHHPESRDRLLALLIPDGKPPWKVPDVDREFRVRGHRADLRFQAHSAIGNRTEVLVETKVNDDLKPAQLDAYCSINAEVIVYGPGLTGLLHTGADRISREQWITGRQILDSLAGVTDLPDLMMTYLGGVRVQADRMDAARVAARGGQDFDRSRDFSEVSEVEVESVAWIAEIAAEMRARGAQDVVPRNTAYDWGIFWRDVWTPATASGKVGFYIDVIAGHGGSGYAITIKVNGGTVEDRFRVFDHARELDRPDSWELGRPGKKESFRVWKRDAEEMTAGEAADATLEAGEFLERAASQISSMR